MKFNSALEMLEFIQAGNSLWSPSEETYVFLYNNVGSICTYHVNQFMAKVLTRLSKDSDSFWESFLGIGGVIYDDPSYENYDQMSSNNLNICENLCIAQDWVLVEELLWNK